jgi:hypothetical protein
MKRMMIFLAIATMLFTLLTLPANAATIDEALIFAKTYVPATATLLSSHESERIYKFIFHDNTAAQTYRIEFQKEPLLLKLLATQVDNYQGAATAVLSKAEIEGIVSLKYPGARNTIVSLDKNNSLYQYIVTFEIDGMFHRLVLNAETGSFLESVSNVGSSVVSDYEISDCYDDCHDDCSDDCSDDCNDVVVDDGAEEVNHSDCNNDCTINCKDDCNGDCNDDCNDVEDNAEDAVDDAIDNAKDAADDAIDNAKDAADDAKDAEGDKNDD